MNAEHLPVLFFVDYPHFQSFLIEFGIEEEPHLSTADLFSEALILLLPKGMRVQWEDSMIGGIVLSDPILLQSRLRERYDAFIGSSAYLLNSNSEEP